jgi:hypothetical protein
MTGTTGRTVLRPAYLVLIAAMGVAACGRSAASSAGEDGKPATPPRSKEVRDAAKLVDVGQCDTAADKLKAYVGDHPEETEAYLVLGDALTCAAFAKAPQVVVPEKLEGARTAYGSALKLAPKDVRASVSVAVLDLLAGRAADTKSLLESARTVDPKNRAVANFLAVAMGPRDSAAVSSLLASVYAERKRSTAPPAIPGFCRPEPPPPSWPHDVTVRIGGSGSCGTAVLLETVEIGGQRYEAGAMLGDVKKSEKGIIFADHVHPGSRLGSGWVLDQIHDIIHWQRDGSLGTAEVLRKHPPDIPRGDGKPFSPASQAVISWAQSWGSWGCGASWCKYPKDIPALQARLGLIDDVVPGSVKLAGAPVTLGGTLVFIPVSYEQFVYDERVVDEKSAARLEIPEAAVPLVIGMAFLAPDEKRALLFGRVFPGVPLLVAGTVLHLDPQRAVLSIKNGEVTMTFRGGEGASLTFVDGELTELRLPEQTEKFGARSKTTGP